MKPQQVGQTSRPPLGGEALSRRDACATLHCFASSGPSAVKSILSNNFPESPERWGRTPDEKTARQQRGRCKTKIVKEYENDQH